MADLSIFAAVDAADIDRIAEAVADRLAPLLATRPRLVDADTLAVMLSVSRPTVDRYRASGLIPSVGVGRARRYDPDAVIAALSASDGGPADAR